jgi:hypothetical protein
MTIEETHTADPLMMNVDGQFLVFYVMDVYPALAESYLSGNNHNRKMREKYVKVLADDMAAGNFDFNGAPILIAEDGTLLDGQHRLMAVVESGATVTMLVIRGFRNATQATVDTGAKRKISDILQLRGEKNCNVLAAVTRLAMAWENGERAALSYAKYSASETLDFINRNPDVREATSHCKTISTRYQVSISHLCLAWWVLNRISPEDNAEFWELLMHPQQAPHPVAALQSRLVTDLANRGRGQRRRALHQLAFVFKTWNLYISGEPCSQIRFKLGGATPEVFPEPSMPID